MVSNREQVLCSKGAVCARPVCITWVCVLGVISECLVSMDSCIWKDYPPRTQTKLDKQSNNASLETLLALLQAEGAKIEEDTENMAEKFLDGELPLDAFIDVYQSKRKLAHMRRVKVEKLQELVLKGQRLPQAGAPLPPRVPEPAPAPALPYPPLEATGLPSVVPRRTPPPPPPVPAGHIATPFTAAMGSGQASVYPGLQCPPLPPRVGLPPQQGFSAQLVSPYPPALPQRPPPRMAPHQPGFILQ